MATTLRGRAPKEVAPGRIKALFFGKPGSGKTYFTVQFPRPFMIDTEGGGKREQYMKRLEAAGGWYLGPEDGGADAEIVLDQIRALTETKHEYRTLIVDSVSKITDTIRSREAEKLGVKDQYGASKKPAIAWARRLVLAIDRLDMNVILIAHEIAEWGQVGDERREVDRIGDVAWEKIPHELDLAMRFVRVNKKLRRAIITKSRIAGFPDGGELAIQDGDSDAGYADFVKRAGHEVLEAEATPVAFATPEQVAEIKRLAAVVNLPEDEKSKWFNLAKVERWEDLTAEQAQKSIEWFMKKVQVSK